MEEKTDEKAMKFSGISLLICFVVYSTVSLTALYSYGSTLHTNILINAVEEDDFISFILRLIFIVIAAMHIPVMFFVGRNGAFVLFDELFINSAANRTDPLLRRFVHYSI